ncbi:MAG TPA: bifunctional phosphopantothenoylcysteine decarboxylase/phosphopantothenate--cysteine ligase CoaBC [Candidatus Limnocylindrales bacterium]|nr:bifunctional phosphopantothenoylcysteine decarboxylase/phosphopantothenate--cysteine ligase CoaBC [Candidatus Limnocylindrales bacterium]
MSQARVLLAVTGGIAAYKTPELVRLLGKERALVSVILTRNARRFVTRDALRAVTRGPVLGNLFEAFALGEGPWFPDSPPSSLGMAHIGMAREANLVLVAPATANLLAKLAHGLADDLVSTALLATRAPVLIAPAMNVAMWEHAAVRENMRILLERGVHFVDPEEGELADGEWGMGRMASLEKIVAAARRTLGAPAVASQAPMILAGRTIVITAGGTEEPIDPVRVITNKSSGKMGFALAEEARKMGATVRLIVARTSAQPPAGIPTTEALTGEAMAKAVRAAMPDADVLVMAAAVSDFAPATPSGSKMKRREGGMSLDLRATPDILMSVRKEFPKKLIVGFALETEDEERGGMEKLKRKGLDLIAVNNPTKPGSAFGSDQNEVILLDRSGETERLSLRPKRDVARAILMRVARSLETAAVR